MSARRAALGYTLIEIVVAFAILALGLTLLLGTLSGASRQLRQAGDAGRAELHAQSLLDELAVLPEPGHRQGALEDGRYHWQLDVAPWAGPGRADAPPSPGAPRLLRVALRMEWGDGGPGQTLQLSSLRLVRASAAGGRAP
jgi:general secretion pathway protein I